MKNRLPAVLAILLVCWIPTMIYAQTISTGIFAINYDTLRIASYNVLNYPADVSTRDPYLRRVIHTMNPDILVVQEMISSSGATGLLNNVLNYYQIGLYTTIAFHDGYDTDNHIYVKSGKASIISAGYIPTALRDIAEYVVRLISSNDTIRLYSLHLKASSGSDNEALRLAEATILRNHLNALPTGTKFIVMGDYNIYTSTEPAFQKLISSETDNDGRCKDPINAVGDWNNNSAFKSIHTQSPRVRQFGGGSTGGMDDRFDIILTSYTSLDNNTIVSSYKAYGNDGNHFNDSINRLPNTAVPDSVAHGLHYGSDHIPVTCNFKFEKNAGSFTLLSPENSATNQAASGTLRWQSSANASAYDVYIDQNNPPTTIVSANQTDTLYSYSNLYSGGVYYWKAVAKNGAKQSTATGSPWNFSIIAANVPAAFSLLSPVDTAPDQTLNGTLTWQSSTFALHYDVYLDVVNPPVMRVDSNITITEYSYSGLFGDTTYYWKIVAKNSSGTTAAINAPWSFSTALPPAAPSDVTTSDVAVKSVQINWVDNAIDEAGYRVYRSFTTGGPYTNISGNLPVNSISFQDTGLLVNQRYYYRINPFNEVGEGNFAAIDISTLASIPDAPTVSDVRPHSLRLLVQPGVNPSSTEFAVQIQSNSDTLYVKHDGTLVMAADWQTYNVWGGASGVTTIGLDSCLILTIKVNARNNDNVETDFSIALIQQLPCYALLGSVENGWNLVSLPLSVSDPRKTAIFPTSISNAFAYEGVYVKYDSLMKGRGYWIKFSATDSLMIFGEPLNLDTIDLAEGWNMIGSITEAILVEDISTNPPGIIVSNFFEYHGSYTVGTSIQPMIGYWVKTNAIGKLIISSFSLRRGAAIPIHEGASLSSAGSITFEDQNNRQQTLFVLDGTQERYRESFYELPPMPPDGGFDARFTSQRYAGVLDSRQDVQEFPIHLTSSSYPVKIKWDIKDASRKFKLLFGKQKLTLEARGNFALHETTQDLVLVGQKIVSAEIPGKFLLYQNYPNPFNPSTIIEYDLPTKSMVTLTVFDVLGNEVAVLDEGVKESGRRKISWQPTVANGLYFYRLIATSFEKPNATFQSVKRMTLLK